MSNPKLQINCSAVETSDGSEWKLRIEVITVGRESPNTRLAIINDPSTQDLLFYEICQAVGEVEKNMDLYRRYSLHYTETQIFRALSELKEFLQFQGTKEIKSKGAMFSSVLHRIAHQTGRMD